MPDSGRKYPPMSTCSLYTREVSADPHSCKGLGSHPTANMCWDMPIAGFCFLPATRLMCMALVMVGKLSQAYTLYKVCCSKPLQPSPLQPQCWEPKFWISGSGVGVRDCSGAARVGMAAATMPLLLVRWHDPNPCNTHTSLSLDGGVAAVVSKFPGGGEVQDLEPIRGASCTALVLCSWNSSAY